MKKFDIDLLVLNEISEFSKTIDKLNAIDDLELKSINYISSLENLDKFNYNLLIINKEKYLELDFESLIINDSKSGIILLTDEKDYLYSFNKLYNKGIIVVERKIELDAFLEIVKLLLFSNLKKNKEIYSHKINEINTIDVAKSILISFQGKNENEAHKYIERLSMDLRTPIGRIAECVISSFIKKRSKKYEY